MGIEKEGEATIVSSIKLFPCIIGTLFVNEVKTSVASLIG